MLELLATRGCKSIEDGVGTGHMGVLVHLEVLFLGCLAVHHNAYWLVFRHRQRLQ